MLKPRTIISGHIIKDPERIATLRVTINSVIMYVVILDSGTGVGIATKAIWESWGKPAIQRMRMSTQLADGSLEIPIGFLEDMKVKSCGIEFKQTFSIVKFRKNTNYKVLRE